MKKLVAGLFLSITTLSASAGTFYDQLCAFNFNWKKYYMQAPLEPARTFTSDQELIRAHQGAVLAILRAAPTDALTDDQRTSRVHMIELLEGYRTAGNFPMNYYRCERIPVFIDEHGTHCAVGYLMMMTGQEEMAQRISHTDNYVWVKDLNDPGVPAWQMASGLSFEELALIQGAYDWYPPNAFVSPDRYETPQMPICTTAYFPNDITTGVILPKSKRVWCKGEGENGVVNGKWEQNYQPGQPWIVGYFDHGKRTGQWEEYFQGTNKLCRTERWCDNKLNGTRERFDMDGNVIEEILFNEGVAVSKINYSLIDSLAYVRIPVDSNRVLTCVYNSKGQLIACGHETIFNPGNLKWFQNIELTALNSAQVTAQNAATSGNSGLNTEGGYYKTTQWAPPLVQYRKEGDWMYFRENAPQQFVNYSYQSELQAELCRHYIHCGPELYDHVAMYKEIKTGSGFDSIRATYSDDNLVAFRGFSLTGYVNLHMEYYPIQLVPLFNSEWDSQNKPSYWEIRRIKETGQYNQSGERIGEWKYYNQDGILYKTENYLIPMREEEDEDQTASK